VLVKPFLSLVFKFRNHLSEIHLNEKGVSVNWDFLKFIYHLFIIAHF
jgi:hypothetical protein